MSSIPFTPRTLSVLVVDDHDPIRKAIKRVLISMGFIDITECFDGSDAIQTLQRKPFDLVICDLYMRSVMGFDVIAHVRSRDIGNDIPFIVVTGEASRDEIVKVADFGADDYVLKPFQAGDFEKKVTSVLTKYYSPSPILNALRLAERHYLAGEMPIALEKFQEALKIDPASMRGVFGKAKTLAATGQEVEALDLLNEAVQHNQSFYKHYSAIADISLKLGRTKQAIRAMSSELEINPKQARRQVQLAKLLLREGDAMGAIEHYREALRETPNIKSALMGMGQAFARLENLEKAFYYLKRVRRYHPTATQALDLVVKIALAGGEEKRAELFLRDEKKFHPDRKDSYVVLAKLYAHLGNYEEAVPILEELLLRDPEHQSAMKMKGIIFMRMKKFKEAAAVFTHLASVAPDLDVYLHLAESHLVLGELDLAFTTLHQSLALDSRHGPTYLVLGNLYEKTNQFLKAYMCFRRAALCGADKQHCQKEARSVKTQIHSRRSPPRRAS